MAIPWKADESGRKEVAEEKREGDGGTCFVGGEVAEPGLMNLPEQERPCRQAARQRKPGGTVLVLYCVVQAWQSKRADAAVKALRQSKSEHGPPMF
jgi:hypothetical protein